MQGRKASPTLAPKAAPAPGVAPAATESSLGEVELGNAAAQERMKAIGTAGAPTDAGGGAPTAPPAGGAPGGGGSGTPGDLPFRAEMEKQFSTEFSDVRVFYNDPKAQAIQAHAFAQGTEIHFGMEQADVGKKLVAHELTHIVQARAGAKKTGGVSGKGDASEGEAREVADSVASGQEAGEITAAPSAGIHRDEKKDPNEGLVGEDKTDASLPGITFRVYPDAWKGALPRPETGITALRAADLAPSIERKKKARVYGDRIVAAASEKNADKWNKAVNAVIVEAEAAGPLILGELYRDSTFLSNPIWNGNSKRLLAIAKMADPVERFVTKVNQLRNDGQKVDLPATIKAFAIANPGDSLRAVASGPMQALLDSLGAGEKIRCILLLMNGGSEAEKPMDKLRIAMAEGNTEKFHSAWPLVVADAAALEELKGDANFLTDVGAAFGAAELASVQALLLRPKSEDLSTEEREKVEGIVASTCKNLAGELTAYWCKDSNVINYLNSFVASVKAVFPTTTPEEKHAAEVKFEKAKTLLKTMYQDYNGKSLEGAINAGLSGDALDQALIIVSARKIAAAPVAGAPVVYSPRLTPAEFNKVQAYLTGGFLKKLHDELTSYWCKDAKVLGYIHEYEAWIPQNIVPEDAQIPDSVNAAALRRKEARKVLEEEYKKNYGKELKAALASGMSDKELAEANAFVAEGARVEEPKAAAEPYVQEMSEKEQQAVDSAARKIAAQVYGELSATFGANGAAVLRLLTSGKETLHSVLTPPDLNAADVKKFWESKTDKAMRRVKDMYDAQFGSMVKAIHDGLSEADQRRALELIGDRSSANKATIDAAVGDTAGDLDFKKRIEEFDVKVTKLAERLYGQLEVSAVSYVSDANVMGICAEFPTLKAEYATLTQSVTFGPTGHLRMLERAYLPLGGSLRRAIPKGLDPENATKALGSLGISDSAASTVARDPKMEAAKASAGTPEDQAKIEAQIVAKQKMTPLVIRAGSALSAFTTNPNSVTALEAPFAAIRAVALPAYAAGPEYIKALKQTWQETNGIEITAQIGLAPYEHQTIARYAGLPDLIVPRKRVSEDEASKKDTSGLEQQNAAFKFDKLNVSPDFTLETAKANAVLCEKYLAARNVAQLNAVLAGNGKKEENRIVLLMFQTLFGYDLKFRMRETFGDSDDFKRMDRLAINAGKAESFAIAISGLVKGGSVEAVYKRVAYANPEEKQQLLDDANTMYDIRQEFGSKAYDRVYRTLTGEITPGDLMRTRDTGAWYTLGFGTDEKGAKDDITQFFKIMRRELLGAAKKKKAGELTEDEKKKVDGDVKNRALRVFADPDLQEMLNSEFSSDELLEMKQLVLGAGEQTGTDKARVAMEGLGTGASILADLKAMKDDERAKKRADATFVARLSDDLSGDLLQQALAILFADEGQDAEADVNGAINDSWYGNVDEDKIFATVTALSRSELIKLANDPLRLAQIRGSLDPKADELVLFDELIAGAKGMGKAIKGDDKADMTEPEKVQRRQHAVLTHWVAIQRGAYSGADNLLAAVQAVYAEKCEVAPKPADKETKVELFSTADRNQVLAKAMPVVRGQYNNGAGWWSVVGPEIVGVVENAILGKADPSLYRLEKGVSGSNNDDAIKGALSGASDDTVLKDWSNILQNGDNGRNFKSVYDAYKAKRGDVSAKHALVDFPFDIAKSLLTVLKQEGNWHDFMTSAGDKELLGLKQTVRDRIVKLTGSEPKGKKIAVKLLGIDLATAEGKEDADLIVGGDREARSVFAHSKDDYQQQMGQGSLIDPFSKTDESLQVAYAEYAGEVGAATDSKKAGEVGQITDDEKEGIDAKLDAFKVSIEEYRAAKDAVAEVMKWVAIAIITAVATALTGPGGPTLLAALLTAAATAGSAAVIDELVKGRDYEFVQEGLKKVVVDTATAALTFGASKWLEAAAKGTGLTGQIASKFVQFQKWQEAVGKGASDSFGGAALAVVWKGTTAGFGKLSDGAVASVDMSQWKYGFNQGMTHTNKTMSGAMEGLPADVGKAMLAQIISSATGAARKEDEPAALDGVEPGDTAIEDPSILGSVGTGIKKSMFSKDTKEALEDQLIDTASKKALSGTMGKSSGWDDKEVGAFMSEFGKGRVEGSIKSAGDDYQTKRNKKNEAIRLAEFSAASGSLPPTEQAAALAYYKQYLESKAKSENGKLGVDPSTFIAGDWAKVKAAVDAQIGKSPNASDEQKEAYRAYIYANPTKFDQTGSLTVEKFTEIRGQATKKIGEVKTSPQYVALSTEQKAFYDTYLSDPNRFANFKTGAVDGIDVRDDAGKAKLLASIAETKKQMVTVLSAGKLPTTWTSQQKTAWENALTNGALPELSPTDTDKNKATVAAFIQSFTTPPVAPVQPVVTPPTTPSVGTPPPGPSQQP